VNPPDLCPETWIDAGAAVDLKDGQSMSIATQECLIAVVRSAGEFFAIEDVCTHDGAELTGGPVEGAEIVCPRHGARFCLRSGAALTPPAYEAVRVFATRLDAGRLWIRAG
jgi:3-phenylpropionate/trans-cinnamate dioxygenase ferredoxin subunit